MVRRWAATSCRAGSASSCSGALSSGEALGCSDASSCGDAPSCSDTLELSPASSTLLSVSLPLGCKELLDCQPLSCELPRCAVGSAGSTSAGGVGADDCGAVGGAVSDFAGSGTGKGTPSPGGILGAASGGAAGSGGAARSSGGDGAWLRALVASGTRGKRSGRAREEGARARDGERKRERGGRETESAREQGARARRAQRADERLSRRSRARWYGEAQQQRVEIFIFRFLPTLQVLDSSGREDARQLGRRDC